MTKIHLYPGLNAFPHCHKVLCSGYVHVKDGDRDQSGECVRPSPYASLVSGDGNVTPYTLACEMIAMADGMARLLRFTGVEVTVDPMLGSAAMLELGDKIADAIRLREKAEGA